MKLEIELRRGASRIVADFSRVVARLEKIAAAPPRRQTTTTRAAPLVNALQNVAKMSFGSLKGKNRFLQNLILNRFFQPFRRGQIDPCSEQIGKAVFEPSHGQKRIVLCLVEIGQ